MAAFAFGEAAGPAAASRLAQWTSDAVPFLVLGFLTAASIAPAWLRPGRANQPIR
jgi:hypothetical protein